MRLMVRPSVDDDAMEDDAEDVAAEEEDVAVDNIRDDQWNGNESRCPIMDGELTSRWPPQLLMAVIMATIAPSFAGATALAFFRTSTLAMTASSIFDFDRPS